MKNIEFIGRPIAYQTYEMFRKRYKINKKKLEDIKKDIYEYEKNNIDEIKNGLYFNVPE